LRYQLFIGLGFGQALIDFKAPVFDFSDMIVHFEIQILL